MTHKISMPDVELSLEDTGQLFLSMKNSRSAKPNVIEVTQDSHEYRILKTLLADELKVSLDENHYSGILGSPPVMLEIEDSLHEKTIDFPPDKDSSSVMTHEENFNYSVSHNSISSVSSLSDFIHLGQGEYSEVKWWTHETRIHHRITLLNVSDKESMQGNLSRTGSSYLLMQTFLSHARVHVKDCKFVIFTVEPERYEDVVLENTFVLSPLELKKNEVLPKKLKKYARWNASNIFVIIDQSVSDRMTTDLSFGGNSNFSLYIRVTDIMNKLRDMSEKEGLKIILWHDYSIKSSPFNRFLPSSRIFIGNHQNYQSSVAGEPENLTLQENQGLISHYYHTYYRAYDSSPSEEKFNFFGGKS